MAEKPYTNREITLLLKALEHRLFDEQEGYLPRIEGQTIKHNGRLKKVEAGILILFGMFASAGIMNPELVAVVKAVVVP